MGNCTHPVPNQHPSAIPLDGVYDPKIYRRKAFPLEKDDQMLPPLRPYNPELPQYIIDISLQHTWCPAGSNLASTDLACVLSLNAPPVPFNQRSGVDLICVIDVSGSMDEEGKLKLVIKTLTFLISQLTEFDRLCIISFDHKATKLMPLTVMNQWGKGYATSVATHLRAGGTTNIVSALHMAFAVALNRNNMNYTLDILILSDGRDDNENSALQRARDCFASFEQYRMSYAVHTFGYGHEHDSELLGEIAYLKNGGFYYIEEVEDVRHAFAHCLGEILSVVARDVRVSLVLEPCQVYVSIRKVHSECGTENFRLPNLSSASSKEAVFILSIPSLPEYLTETLVRPVKAIVSFVMVSTGEVINVERYLEIDFANKTQGIEIHYGLMIQLHRVRVSEVLKLAGELGKQQNFSGAREMVETEIQNLKRSEYCADALVQVLILDLENALLKLKDRRSWRRGGHAYFRHMYHGHWAKRAEKHELYSNDRQKDMRSQIQNYILI